jgi:hypothetical protein
MRVAGWVIYVVAAVFGLFFVATDYRLRRRGAYLSRRAHAHVIALALLAGVAGTVCFIVAGGPAS